MQGIWFAVLVAAFIAIGVATQLGWPPGPIPVGRLVLRRDKDTLPDTPGSVGGPP
jgi:hypothetical protein